MAGEAMHAAKGATVSTDFCERIIDKVAAHCAVQPDPPSHVDAKFGEPNWDHLANSFALAGDAIMYATFALALVVAIGTIGWLLYVRHRTHREAKKEVARVVPQVVPEHVKAYLDDKVPGLVAEAVAALATTRSATGGMSAEDQARDLGGEPR